jgi:hypothetical protein
MCENEATALTFETLLRDPLAHMVMASDGVGVAELKAVLEEVRAAMAAREMAEIGERAAT